MIEGEDFFITVAKIDRKLRENSFLQEEISELKKQLSSMTKHIDVVNLKEWFESQRVQKPWLYNGVRLGKKDVKIYLTPKDDKPFIAKAREIINHYKISPKTTPTKVVEYVMKYYMRRSSQWNSGQGTILMRRRLLKVLV